MLFGGNPLGGKLLQAESPFCRQPGERTTARFACFAVPVVVEEHSRNFELTALFTSTGGAHPFEDQSSGVRFCDIQFRFRY